MLELSAGFCELHVTPLSESGRDFSRVQTGFSSGSNKVESNGLFRVSC
jgi:hypothetical protein